MIISFRCKETEKIWNGNVSLRLPREIQQLARRKLRILASVVTVEELRIPPSNHLEKLKGDKAGLFSIRINRQWRICFEFRNSNAYSVEIIDYH